MGGVRSLFLFAIIEVMYDCVCLCSAVIVRPVLRWDYSKSAAAPIWQCSAIMKWTHLLSWAFRDLIESGGQIRMITARAKVMYSRAGQNITVKLISASHSALVSHPNIVRTFVMVLTRLTKNSIMLYFRSLHVNEWKKKYANSEWNSDGRSGSDSSLSQVQVELYCCYMQYNNV